MVFEGEIWESGGFLVEDLRMRDLRWRVFRKGKRVDWLNVKMGKRKEGNYRVDILDIKSL